MRIFITGVSCVGKTTIGSVVASKLGFRFFDLDEEIERFFGCSIERLQNKFLTIHSFRDEAAKALKDILSRPESRNCVIALPPSGLMGGYLRVVRKTEGTTVALMDRPENILKRITFYDIDSHPIEKQLSSKEELLYLREIKKDITYYRDSYNRSDLQVDVSGLSPEQAAGHVIQSLESAGRLQQATPGNATGH
jgi:shikimate kinase